MKCAKQFRFHRLPISNLWEVYLDGDLWERIKRVSARRNCSYSWITRYCAFRVARKKVVKFPRAMEKLSREVKEHYRKTPMATSGMHRHMMCLYGEDEKLLKVAAMELGMTVSHLIRVALYRNLPKLEKETFDWRFVYYYGTRICRFVHMSRQSFLSLPLCDNLFYAKWPLDSWWGRPIPIIPVPESPDENGPSWLFRLMGPNATEMELRALHWHLTR